MKRTTQTKADLLRANADLLRTNAALRQTNTRLHADMEDLNKNLKQAVARETAELQEQAIIKAEAIDGLKDQVAALMERVRDLNRQLLDEKSARKKEALEAANDIEAVGKIKDKVWRELVDLQASYRELQAENARIKSLHASSMEFIGTHIHFLKANVQ